MFMTFACDHKTLGKDCIYLSVAVDCLTRWSPPFVIGCIPWSFIFLERWQRRNIKQCGTLCREVEHEPCTVQGSLYLFPCRDLGMCDPFCLLCCQSVALFVCLSVLGIVFPPNAALYWLCEFLNRNWPNSLQEFRSLLQIMGQFGEIYWAHICPPDLRNISTSKIKFCSMSSMAWKSFVK